MLNTFAERIREVSGHYAAGDASLGFRRLLDAALETENPIIHRQALDYCEWLEDFPEGNPAEVQARANDLLQAIATAGAGKPYYADGPILTVEGLGKRYAKGGFELRDVKLEVQPGGITGLVGQNGHGKTTLLRLLAAELEPESGVIQYHLEPRPADRYDLRTRLVYIEQRIPKWYGSLMDNLQFVQAHYGVTGEPAALKAELLVARLGLRPYRHLNWNRISSGYRTRFEIAKALLRKPRLLLLDEPLANLDIVAQQTLLQDLRFMAGSLSAPFGMLLSSQHIYEVEKVSDHIIFLEKGQPRYQSLQEEVAEQTVATPLLLELETESSREVLAAAFAGCALENIKFNGGVYLLQFSAATSPSMVWSAIAASGLDVGYLRNISRSSRRFFINP